MVGRIHERRRLAGAWESAAREGARLAVVSGEPGIGKTRLVEELRADAAARGAVTAEARAYAAEGAMAYGLAAEWLAAGPAAAAAAGLPAADRAELARLRPELRARAPDAAQPPPPAALPDDEQRRRLFAALGRALLAAGGPLLLVADDIQWADRESLRFVHHLLRTASGLPLMVAATVRHEEVDAGHPARALIEGMRALGRIDEMRLRRLAPEETGALARRLRGRPLTDGEIAALHARSEGNPLFIVEAERLGGAGADGAGSVDGIIAARLAGLSPAAGDLLGLAAVVGREFTARALEEAAGADPDAVVDALEELWRRGLVRARGPDAYDFSHQRIREAALGALSPARRRRHHLRLAGVLAARPAEDLDALSGQIAAHHEAAGDDDAAARWHARAAAAAQALHATDDALRSLDRAAELVRRGPAGPARRRRELELLAGLPPLLVPHGGYASARMDAVHRRARAVARELGAPMPAPLARSMVLADLAHGRFARAEEAAVELRARAEADGDGVLWVETAYALGVADFWRGRLTGAEAHFRAARDRYRPADAERHLRRYGQDPHAFCTVRLAYVLWLRGRDDEAAARMAEGARLADASPDRHTRVGAAVWGAVLALDRRDPPDRIAALLAPLEPLRASLWQARLAHGVFGAYLEAVAGATGSAVAALRGHLEEVLRRPTAPGAAGIAGRVLAECLDLGGGAGDAAAEVDRLLALGRGAALWEAELRRLRARMLARAGAGAPAVAGELARALAVAGAQDAAAFARRIRGELPPAASRARHGAARSMRPEGGRRPPGASGGGR